MSYQRNGVEGWVGWRGIQAKCGYYQKPRIAGGSKVQLNASVKEEENLWYRWAGEVPSQLVYQISRDPEDKAHLSNKDGHLY